MGKEKQKEQNCRIRKKPEKENFKYFETFEAGIIEQAEMKEKKLAKSTSKERENVSKPSSAEEILSKE